MKKSSVLSELELSPVMLGTVQFGMQYGIANRGGQPSYETAKDIVRAMYEGGVTCFDTAAAYGSSEEVLGQVLLELGISEKVTVATKIPRVPADMSKTSEIDDFVEKNVLRSMHRLQVPYLPICLFHVEEDFRCADSLLKMKEKGLVRHVGFSVMTPSAAAKITASGIPEAIQIPTSILDHRFRRGNILVQAKRSGCAVFIRSVYLQGLLLLAKDEIKGRFEEAKPVIERLRSIAEEAGINVSELAIRYVLSLEGCTCAVIGVDSLAQADANIQAFQKGTLDKELMAEIDSAVPDLPDEILTPTLWHK
jgi:aryl-alcohol dehydrogenase-like predicted oxidoreductase